MSSESALWLAALAFAFLPGCGSTSDSGSGNGGSSALGGASAGGSSATTGGSGSGGSPSGGAANGGALSTTGGAFSPGGALNASGGRFSGAGSGGRAGGGIGGARATGGAGAGPGGGGRSSGGATAAGGAAPAAGAGGASPGCGSANTTSPCSKSGTTCSLDISGTARTYYVQLPSNYDPSKPYPVVFQFHPMGGNAEQALNMYRISSGLPNAIYVTPQGMTENGNTGWANTGGRDIAFTKAMVEYVQTNYCVDNARIFSTGFSYGGMMSFAVGCEMSNVFRAIAPMSGALYSDFNCKGTGPAIAMWGSHGTNDQVVPIDDGRAALKKILQQNHCGTETTPIDPSPCVAYQGCDSGYPVTWCEWDGPHGMPNFGSSAIAAFFKQF